MLVFYALAYAGSFHYVYYVYLSEVFNYAYYNYLNRELYYYLFSYLLCIFPLLFRSDKDGLARFSFDIIYFLIYIPSQLMLVFMWKLDLFLYYLTAFSLLIAIIIIALPSLVFSHCSQTANFLPGRIFNSIIYAVSFIGVLLLFYSYGSTMKIVGFDQVYDLRSEANLASKGGVVDYFVAWLTFLSLPYFFSYAIVKKSFFSFFIGILISISLYAAHGAKIAILNSFIIFSLYFVLKLKGDFLVKALFFSSVLFLLIAFILPDDGPWLWAKSIFMVRVFSNAGWMIVTYSEFFYENGYTFFSHIGILNKFLDSYPFGSLTPGQLIGLEYMGTAEANFNANFLASDGIAAIGPLGLPIIAIIYTVFISFYSSLTKRINVIFLLLFSSGFLMSLLNAPLSTAILSGGGALMLVLFFVDSLKIKKHNKGENGFE